MQTITKQKIKTFLPVFSGFYNSIWEFDDDSVLYNVNETRQEKRLLELENCENFDIDYKGYENEIAEKSCEVLKEKLSDFIESIEFENIYSPKEYNFSNDSINCIIEVKHNTIKDFIYKNKDAFCKYLKEKYTSYDGFISSYSNEFSEWKIYTSDFNWLDIDTHTLGAILQFICNQLGIDNDALYSEVIENVYADNYLINYAECYEALTCNECNKFIQDDNIKNDAGKYKELMGKSPAHILCIECLENI